MLKTQQRFINICKNSIIFVTGSIITVIHDFATFIIKKPIPSLRILPMQIYTVMKMYSSKLLVYDFRVQNMYP